MKQPTRFPWVEWEYYERAIAQLVKGDIGDLDEGATEDDAHEVIKTWDENRWQDFLASQEDYNDPNAHEPDGPNTFPNFHQRLSHPY